MNGNYLLAIALGIGFVAGLRSFTAPAVVAWAAHLGWLNLQDSRLAFMGSTAAVTILSLLALGELFADKVPGVPRRTSIGPLLARIGTGALSGACLGVAANQSLLPACVLGGVGGVVGAFVGYEVRRQLVTQRHFKDFVVAVVEDLTAIGLACLLVFR